MGHPSQSVSKHVPDILGRLSSTYWCSVDPASWGSTDVMLFLPSLGDDTRTSPKTHAYRGSFAKERIPKLCLTLRQCTSAGSTSPSLRSVQKPHVCPVRYTYILYRIQLYMSINTNIGPHLQGASSPVPFYCCCSACAPGCHRLSPHHLLSSNSITLLSNGGFPEINGS
jgi:hypothetical protein